VPVLDLASEGLIQGFFELVARGLLRLYYTIRYGFRGRPPGEKTTQRTATSN